MTTQTTTTVKLADSNVRIALAHILSMAMQGVAESLHDSPMADEMLVRGVPDLTRGLLEGAERIAAFAKALEVVMDQAQGSVAMPLSPGVLERWLRETEGFLRDCLRETAREDDTGALGELVALADVCRKLAAGLPSNHDEDSGG
jgi:hypothetical protein